MIAPFYLILVNSFKSPVDYATAGPLALPQALDFTGIAELLGARELPREGLELDLHLGHRRGARRAHLDAERLRDRHRTGPGSLVDRAAVPDGQPAAAGGAALPAVLHVQVGAPLRQRVVGHHRLHGDPGGVRHLPALVGATARSPRRSSRRRRSTARPAGRSCGGSSSRSAGRRCRCCSSSSSSGRGTSSSSR